ncbi:hypothetical protein GCM10010429_40590 [Micromonospora olivasterospora]
MTLYVSHITQPDAQFPTPAPAALGSPWREQTLSTASQRLRRAWRLLTGREATVPSRAAQSDNRHCRAGAHRVTPGSTRPSRSQSAPVDQRPYQHPAARSASQPRALGPANTAVENNPRWAKDATVALPMVGQAGYPTVAQAWRGRGGRW